MTVSYSVLDLAPVVEGSTPAVSFENSVQLAQLAESLGYRRYWLAEHHNMAGIASAATSVLLCHIGDNTSTIRIGSGGIMLPNHSPLVIAEQFGTLATLFGDRIDLGLGRAPGTDQVTMRALRRQPQQAVDSFPQDVQELQHYFDDQQRSVNAVPGQGLHVPLWLLGSSLYSAQLAAQMGLPFAFAAHFAPDMLLQALRIYREQFTPSAQCPAPYTMLCVNLIAADDTRQAEYLFTSLQQQFLQLYRGTPGKIPLPRQPLTGYESFELNAMERTLRRSLVGGPQKIRAGIEALLAETEVNELMFNGPITDPAARFESFAIGAQVMQDINADVHTTATAK
ncbi:LLM class flavin-dependent oxidoreductase [Shewanella sp. C32]|uniref:LLM class flavin-dependent oxidoreductase n=1 Tax=Shewanella electrica TaxID=515560 RepID=A0ABT2FFB6_9GAMM|nr:LLM class flavin-dependent oxidoreductase [Shewanella electrica]MCH1925149.1 LLM class flavin-dependent oxidoreductase [Shewanella electrica]MCS4554973.1 LLM class flavin-dependent oxidoreductase [Shewanella electrica]